jgi:hypothetical protein
MSRQTTGCITVIALLTALFPVAAMALDVNLNGQEIRIDQITGTIVRLSSPANGSFLQAAPDSAGGIDLAYPVEAFSPMRLAARFSRAQVIRDGSSLRIVWRQLGPSRNYYPMPEGTVEAELSFRPASNGKSVIVRAKVVPAMEKQRGERRGYHEEG